LVSTGLLTSSVSHPKWVGFDVACRIWIFDNDEVRLATLKAAFEGFSEAIFLKFEKLLEVLHAQGLDALYLSPPYAERWGARPVFHRAEILRPAGWRRVKLCDSTGKMCLVSADPSSKQMNHSNSRTCNSTTATGRAKSPAFV
jgi:hypothetical protein